MTTQNERFRSVLVAFLCLIVGLLISVCMLLAEIRDKTIHFDVNCSESCAVIPRE
jgi:type III secretory pathway component EscS